ncbi:MAG TPA: hypothetical protein VGE52_02970 [Pirellulales bacterium]
MFIVWSGAGILAFLAGCVPIFTFALLVDRHPTFGLNLACAIAIAEGVALRHYGIRWNSEQRVHTLYWIPLEYWGWFYFLTGGLGMAGSTVKAIRDSFF